jgi:hypothetical protein
MFKNLVEKIKNANPLVLGFVGFIIIIIILAIISWTVDSTKIAPSAVDVLVSPTTATVKIGEKTYENGRHDLAPGNYHVEISLEEFNTYTDDITINPGDNYELYITLDKTVDSAQWYAERPDEDRLYTSISDKNYEKDSRTFAKNNPVVDILPYHCTKYENNYATYIEYRIDYKISDDGQNAILLIKDITGDNKKRALQYIREHGHNPDDYQIEYSYTPREAPAMAGDQ